MGVAGQAHEFFAQLQGCFDDLLAFCAVAVPGIEVVGDVAGPVEQGLFGRAQWQPLGQLLQRSGVLGHHRRIAGIEQQFSGDGHVGHQRAAAEGLPGRLGGGELAAQPVELLGADHRAIAVVGLIDDRSDARR